MMNKTYLTLLIAIVVLVAVSWTNLFSKSNSEECCGKCVGSAYCNACTSCQYCKYCNSGGSCGVCSSGISRNTAPPKQYITPKRAPQREIIQYTRIDTSAVVDQVEDVQQTAVVIAEELNLREGPGTSYKVLAVLTLGTALDIVGSATGTWVHVIATDGDEDVEGYVSRKYIDIQ